MIINGHVFAALLLLNIVWGDEKFNPVSHKNWKLLPKENKCGLSAQQRIVGGRAAALGEFPWIVRIGYQIPMYGDIIMYSCGGTLISKNYILTASHCALQPKEIVQVRLGENFANTNPDCISSGKICAPPVQDIPIVKVLKHEKFSYDKHMMNDIALLKMKHPPKLNRYVQPICLPYGPILDGSFEKEMTTVAGWGLTEKRVASDILLGVKQRVYDKEACRKKYKASGIHLDQDNSQLCVGGVVGKDSCNGDSGGPLMWIGTSNGSSACTFLLGIVSMGPTDCGLNIPGVYTRTSFFMKWILDHID